MEYKKACKTGSDGWALRISGDNIIVTNMTNSYIYTDEETLKLSKNCRPSSVDSWMPLPKFPNYIPLDQNHKFFKEMYKKFRNKELERKIIDKSNS
jgi:hypothetical protein